MVGVPTSNSTMDFNFNMINFELHKEDELTGKQFIEVLRCSDDVNPADFDHNGMDGQTATNYDMIVHRYPNTYYDSSGGGGYGHNDLSPTSGSDISYFSSHSPFSPANNSTENGGVLSASTPLSVDHSSFTSLSNCGTPLSGVNGGNNGGLGLKNSSSQHGVARKKGGRKKNLRPPSPTVLKQRREAANARERKRMNGLNDAFERLREVSLIFLNLKFY